MARSRRETIECGVDFGRGVTRTGVGERGALGFEAQECRALLAGVFPQTAEDVREPLAQPRRLVPVLFAVDHPGVGHDRGPIEGAGGGDQRARGNREAHGEEPCSSRHFGITLHMKSQHF